MDAVEGARLRGPIFLAGSDRSGIGLLGELLERHPRIAMTRRSNFWTRYRGRFGDLRRSENVDRCLASMADDRRMKVFAPDRDRLLADLTAEPTYERMFESIQRQRMERLGKARWGDKSLGSERHAKEILRCFPEARMIHVVRDPRDRYASQKYHRQVGRGGVGAGAAMWLHSVRLAERNTRRHPDRYLVVHYESLVRDPEGVLRRVCDFVGEAYAPDLLPGGKGAVTSTATPAAAEPGVIHTRSVGRFRGQLSPQETLILQLAAGRRLRRHGYPVEPVELAWPAWVRFAIADLPLNAMRMILWAPWAKLGMAGGWTTAPRT